MRRQTDLIQRSGRAARRCDDSDLLAPKVVAGELGVSRTTLWRASASRLPGFPPPVRIGRAVFWRRGDLGALETALMHFGGRGAFERARSSSRIVDALQRQRRGRAGAAREGASKSDDGQGSLFDWTT